MSESFNFEPGLSDTATIELGVTRDGLSQLRRHWSPPEPRAVVLLVHGIAEHCGRYEHVARQMNAANIAVVGYDQRGFGDSGGRRAYVSSFRQYHDDVEDHLAQVRELGLPTVLLGHSMGGLVAAGYALTSRPQPDSVVLSAPALGADAPSWLARPLSVAGRALGNTKVRLPLDPNDLSTDPRVAEDYNSDPLVYKPASMRLVGEMARSMRMVEAKLAGWHLPALVVHGLDDKIIPPEVSEPMGTLPAVDRRTYAGMRHELFNEPDGPEVVADIIDWLS